MPPTLYNRSAYVSETPAEALAKLREFGVAVVPGVLTGPECKVAFDGIVAGMERVVDGFSARDSTTWALLRKRCSALHGMLLQHFGVGWMQPVVDVRQNPKLAAFWAQLWTEIRGEAFAPEDMLCSADGIALYLIPKDETAFGFAPKVDGLHMDRPVWDRQYMVQGFVNLLPTHRGGAGFHFLEGSHRHQREYAERFYPPTNLDAKGKPIKMPRFCGLRGSEQRAFFLKAKGCISVCIKAAPGDLVLWDSRVAHEGRPALKPDAPPAEDHRRAVVYVAMQPRVIAKDEDLRKKRIAWEEKRLTRCPAARNVSLFAPFPRFFTDDRRHEILSSVHPVKEAPYLTPLGRRLFGVDD